MSALTCSIDLAKHDLAKHDLAKHDLAKQSRPIASVFNSKNQMAASSDDSAGNLLLATGLTLTYDAENRQVSATEQPNLNSTQELYLYDGNGQRVEKIAPAGNTIYVFDWMLYSFAPGICQLGLRHKCG